MNNVRCEASRHFRNKKREYLKEKINDCATNSKNKNIRDLYGGINEFKRGYQRRSNLLKDENSDLLADSYNIFNGWKKYFSQLLNVQSVTDVGLLELHTAESLVPEIEIAIAELKKYKPPSSYQIPAELIQAGGDHYCLQSTSSLTLFGIGKNCLISGWSLLLYQFMKKDNDKIM
jgi:hypothetical protein